MLHAASASARGRVQARVQLKHTHTRPTRRAVLRARQRSGGVLRLRTVGE
jgi:hypothetical protein